MHGHLALEHQFRLIVLQYTTSFTFPEDNQATCEMFQFSVTAYNHAGESIPTIIHDTKLIV